MTEERDWQKDWDLAQNPINCKETYEEFIKALPYWLERSKKTETLFLQLRDVVKTVAKKYDELSHKYKELEDVIADTNPNEE